MNAKKKTATVLVSSVIRMADSLRLRDTCEAGVQRADRMEAEAEAEAQAEGLNLADVIDAAYKLVYGHGPYVNVNG